MNARRSKDDVYVDFNNAYGMWIKGFIRTTTFVLMMIFVTPVQALWRLIGRKNPLLIQRKFYYVLLRVLKFQVYVHGEVSTARPTLFVSNHTSYLDIPVLGAITPGSFVAKAEVETWPMIGVLSRLLNTVFIERRSSQIGKQRTQLRAHLEAGRSLILFPEGTSTDGLRVLPFKSSLFSIVEDVPADVSMTIQPVSITCTGVGGLPMMRAWRPFYAWYGDMTFIDHLWNVFKIGGFRIDVQFHAPIQAKDFSNRKTLATYCHAEVARGIEASLRGRKHALLSGVEMRELAAPV